MSAKKAAAAKKNQDANHEDEVSNAVRKFEVVSAINLGGGDIRKPGATVLDHELSAADLKEMLDSGRLRDGDAPISPSQAEGVREITRLISIGKQIGIIEQSGGEYTFGDIKAQGLLAFRAAVSADALEKAIVDAATSENE
jgi:hypothetical protein